ncbi:hypothetical protein XJ44_02175 [Thermosipho affectus]|uniref:Uncharacterized protein n=1 Tax=Thermosipho affectus TaxID=660294 RepID=A0ABX3IIZ3_9BACT|nr:hypothetical protein [Thermosipho affectus]ONN27795.1 hypothetical protein XJ44_02175 [Thermosipho affectus]
MEKEDKLKNILELKKKLEKELVKTGKKKKEKIKNNPKSGKDIKKLKEKLIKKANISKEDSYTIFDINKQDYDASIEEIINTLRKFSTTDKIFLALINILEGNFDEASKFLNQNTVISKYNLLLTKLYKKQNISNEIVEFIKNNTHSIYPYLLLLEYYIANGLSKNFSKILSQLSNIDSFFKIILDAYMGNQIDTNTLKNIIKTKVFPSLTLFFIKKKNFESENTKSFCLNTNYSLIEGKIPPNRPYCIKSVFANTAWALLNGREINLNNLKRFEKTPEYNLFFGFFYYNNNLFEKSKIFFSKFENQVEKYEIKLLFKKETFVGLKQFYYIPRGYQKKLSGNIFDIIHQNPEYDFYVEYFDPEVVRLLFSEKHCKLIYGD